MLVKIRASAFSLLTYIIHSPILHGPPLLSCPFIWDYLFLSLASILNYLQAIPFHTSYHKAIPWIYVTYAHWFDNLRPEIPIVFHQSLGEKYLFGQSNLTLSQWTNRTTVPSSDMPYPNLMYYLDTFDPLIQLHSFITLETVFIDLCSAHFDGISVW